MAHGDPRLTVNVGLTYDPAYAGRRSGELREQITSILQGHVEDMRLPINLHLEVASGEENAEAVSLSIAGVHCRRPHQPDPPPGVFSLVHEAESIFLTHRHMLVTDDLAAAVARRADWLSVPAAREFVSRVVAEGFSLEEAIEEARPWDTRATDPDTMERWSASLTDQSIGVHLNDDQSDALAAAFDGSGPADGDTATFATMREGLFYELGVRIGDVRRLPARADDSRFRIRINRLSYPSVSGIPRGTWLVNETAERLGLIGVAGEPAVFPADYGEAAVVRSQDAVAACRRAGLTAWDTGEHLILALGAAVRHNAARLVTLSQVEYELAVLEAHAPDLVAAIGELVPTERLTRLLRRLVEEGVSIRNLPRILQATADLHLDQACPDDETCLRRARAALSRHITQRSPNGSLPCYLIASEVSECLRAAATNPLEGAVVRSLVDAVRSTVPARARDAIIAVPDDLRATFRKLIAVELPHVKVLAFGELAPDVAVYPIDRVPLS